MKLPDEQNGSPLEIHPQHVVIRRHGWEMREEIIPAFVKISTDFKTELASIDANSLKVWIYIALSINRNTEEAHPGIRTIATGCNLAPNTVTASVKKLEELGLLTVIRDDRKYNLYQVPHYVSANSKTTPNSDTVETVANFDTAVSNEQESVANQNETVATKPESVATALRLNQINQNNQNEPENSKTVANFDTAVSDEHESVANQNETVATKPESVANQNETVATESESVATALRLNQINQINQNEPENSEKEKILQDLQGAAVSVFYDNRQGWRNLERELEQDQVQIHRLDGQLIISGLGAMKAGVFQDRYARSFENVLAGVYNQGVEVVFQE